MTGQRKWFIPMAALALAASFGRVVLGDDLPRDLSRKYDAEPLLALYAKEQPQPKPVVLADIDDTLMKFGTTDEVRFVLHLRSRNIKQLEGASDAIRHLQQNWNVVILTARDDVFKEQTYRWLERQRFPSVPVVFSSKLRLTQRSQGDFKRQAIGQLKARGLRPAVGIGDSVADARAYLSSGMRAFIIIDDKKDEDFIRISQDAKNDPKLKPYRDRLLFFERNQPTPVWERIVEELKK